MSWVARVLVPVAKVPVTAREVPVTTEMPITYHPQQGPFLGFAAGETRSGVARFMFPRRFPPTSSYLDRPVSGAHAVGGRPGGAPE